jgi:hypothetical protein
MFCETLGFYPQLTRLYYAREKFIEYCENFSFSKKVTNGFRKATKPACSPNVAIHCASSFIGSLKLHGLPDWNKCGAVLALLINTYFNGIAFLCLIEFWSTVHGTLNEYISLEFRLCRYYNTFCNMTSRLVSWNHCTFQNRLTHVRYCLLQYFTWPFAVCVLL